MWRRNVQSIVSLKCRDVVELARDHLDGRLAPRDAATFEQHLHACSWCMTYMEQLRATIALLAELGRS